MLHQEHRIPGARQDLLRLLTPSAIALVGASTNPQVTSGQPLRYMKEFGYQGKLYPVNPKRKEVQGLPCYDSVLSVPDKCDVAVITVAAPHVPGIIRDCGKANIPFAIILSAGFEETDGAGFELQTRLREAISDSGVRVVGPNSTGVVNLQCRSYCAQGGALSDPKLQAGSVAVVAQSGGVGLSMLAFIQGAGVGTNYLVSSGNEIDLDVFDFVDYLLVAPDVSLIALHLESSTDGRRIRALGRLALELGKPIVVLKAGNTGTARTAATSHTGRLTADYELFRAAFREGGYIEVSEMDELVDVSKALQGQRRPSGKRAAILSTSGGWGVMIAERCEQYGLELPTLSPDTLTELGKLAPSYASLRNPIDMTPQGYNDQYASYNEMSRYLLADPGIDLLVVRSATGADMKVWAERLIQVAEASGKPVFVNWAPSLHRYTEVKELLEHKDIPCISYAGRLARVAAASIDFALKLVRLQTVSEQPAQTASGTPPQLPLRKSPGAMGESASKKCLQAYQIPTTDGLLIQPNELDKLDLRGIRFPVAVKVESADLPHKTEVGGVALNVKSVPEVEAAARLILDRVRSHAPAAGIDGILVQEMVSGLEMILGAVNDPHFGPYVMVGMGGIFAEVMRDVSYRFAPVTKVEAMEMVWEVKGKQLLRGMRGQPARDVDALADAIAKLSRLILDHQNEIAEIEINPLIVRAAGEGVAAADCIIIIK